MTTPTLRQRAERLREALAISANTSSVKDRVSFERWNEAVALVNKEAETLRRLMETFPEKMYEASEYEQGFNYCRAEVLKIIGGENDR